MGMDTTVSRLFFLNLLFFESILQSLGRTRSLKKNAHHSLKIRLTYLLYLCDDPLQRHAKKRTNKTKVSGRRRDLGRSLDQCNAPSRVRREIRWGCSWFYPAEIWKSPRTQVSSPPCAVCVGIKPLTTASPSGAAELTACQDTELPAAPPAPLRLFFGNLKGNKKRKIQRKKRKGGRVEGGKKKEKKGLGDRMKWRE